jgi:hypothetical protein
MNARLKLVEPGKAPNVASGPDSQGTAGTRSPGEEVPGARVLWTTRTFIIGAVGLTLAWIVFLTWMGAKMASLW